MIFIAAREKSPRLEYILHVLFENLLNTEYRLINFEEAETSLAQDTESSIIYYSGKNEYGPGSFTIPDEGLLFEDTIRKQEPGILKDSYLKLKFSPTGFSDFTFDFDLFSSAFYLLSEYVFYANPKFDAHGRYDEESYTLYREHHHKYPVLHQYAEALRDKLHSLNPALSHKERKFDYTLSFDIDAPYLYKGRGVLLQATGMLKEALSLKLKRLGIRFSYYFSGKDPYDVYKELLAKAPSNKLLFFFLLDRKSDFDGRYTYKSVLYRKLIRHISDKGIKTGIHPSYTSFLDQNRIIFEKNKLEEITGKEVSVSRMHFLRFRLPDTPRYLQFAGIREDYTACPVYKPGFKNFIAVPFLWFDLKKNQVSGLMLHPTMVMDSTLQKYMGKDSRQAAEIIKEFIDITKKYKGQFVLLFHNSTLSEMPEWRGWTKVFNIILTYLTED